MKFRSRRKVKAGNSESGVSVVEKEVGEEGKELKKVSATEEVQCL